MREQLGHERLWPFGQTPPSLALFTGKPSKIPFRRREGEAQFGNSASLHEWETKSETAGTTIALTVLGHPRSIRYQSETFNYFNQSNLQTVARRHFEIKEPYQRPRESRVRRIIALQILQISSNFNPATLFRFTHRRSESIDRLFRIGRRIDGYFRRVVRPGMDTE